MNLPPHSLANSLQILLELSISLKHSRKQAMVRSPSCFKEGMNRGAWTASKDKILTDYIQVHGEGKWRNIPEEAVHFFPFHAGLKRCGKTCSLRWMNYLRTDTGRENISSDEENLITRLHKLLGNRWSLIAGRLPGRTDNEIKNYWNTHLSKRGQRKDPRPKSKHSKAIPPSTDGSLQLNVAAESKYSDRSLNSLDFLVDINAGETSFSEVFTSDDFTNHHDADDYTINTMQSQAFLLPDEMEHNWRGTDYNIEEA